MYCLENLFENSEPALQIVLRRHERRQNSDRMVAGSQHQQTRFARATNDVPGWLANVQSPHESHAANRADAARSLADRVQLRPYPLPCVLHVREQRRVSNSLQHMERDRRDERSTAEGRSVVAGIHRRGNTIVDQHRAHGQPTRDWLCECEQVGLDADLLIGEERARAPHSALNLIEDQRHLSLASESPQLTNESMVEDPHAALTLHWLENQ